MNHTTSSSVLLLCFFTVNLFGGKQLGFSLLNLSHITEGRGSCAGTQIVLRDGKSFCAADDFTSLNRRIEACSVDLP